MEPLVTLWGIGKIWGAIYGAAYLTLRWLKGRNAVGPYADCVNIQHFWLLTNDLDLMNAEWRLSKDLRTHRSRHVSSS